MLADALERALRSESAAHALATDVKDESAAAFYQRHGLVRLPDQALTLLLPLATARSLVHTADSPPIHRTTRLGAQNTV